LDSFSGGHIDVKTLKMIRKRFSGSPVSRMSNIDARFL